MQFLVANNTEMFNVIGEQARNIDNISESFHELNDAEIVSVEIKDKVFKITTYSKFLEIYKMYSEFNNGLLLEITSGTEELNNMLETYQRM